MSDNGTASAVERLLACPASGALPQVIDVYDDDDDRDRGTAIHAFNATVLNGGDRALALAAVPSKWRSTCAGINHAKIWGGLHDVRAEVAYAINVGNEEARELGVSTNRDYAGLSDMEVAGTNDAEGEQLDGIPVADDLKTGLEVTPCAENPQMMFHTRARQLRTGAPEVFGRVLYVRETGFVHIDEHLFTTIDLEIYEDRLVDMIARVRSARAELAAGQMPTVHPGYHCKYCPSLPACPAYTALARSMLPDIEGIADKVSSIANMTPLEAGAAWVKLDQIKRLVETVKDALRGYAEQQPIPVGYGKEVRKISFAKSYFSKSLAIDLLRMKGATEDEINACADNRIEEQFRVVKVRGAA